MSNVDNGGEQDCFMIQEDTLFAGYGYAHEAGWGRVIGWKKVGRKSLALIQPYGMVETTATDSLGRVWDRFLPLVGLSAKWPVWYALTIKKAEEFARAYVQQLEEADERYRNEHNIDEEGK